MSYKYHELTDQNDLRRLWCDVYDGAVAWEGRTAFEQIAWLHATLERVVKKAKSVGGYDLSKEEMSKVIDNALAGSQDE